MNKGRPQVGAGQGACDKIEMGNSMKLDTVGAERLRQKYGILFFPRLRGEVAVYGADADFERFSQHLPGRFMPLGSYSYARSFFPHVARIGRYCSIGEDVEVMGNRHPLDWISSSPVFYRRKRARAWGSERLEFPSFEDLDLPVEIGNDVWIGDKVLLAHSVKLGTGCVVAARSVVTCDVPPYAIAAGSPARVIRTRFDDTTAERLLASRWWDWPVSAWDGMDPRTISTILDHIDEIRETLPPMTEARFTANTLIKSMSNGDMNKE